MTTSLLTSAEAVLGVTRTPRLFAPKLVVPSRALTTKAKRGMELVNLRRYGFMPGFAGGAVDENTRKRGYNAAADLVTQTNDGVDLNSLWDEYQSTVALQNAKRQLIVDFLTFPVTNPIERVAQISGADFEEATEYGEPVGIRPATSYFQLGYDLKWYDLAARYTWKFLADATQNQVDAINSMALEADNRLIFDKVMDTLFNPANRLADINGLQDVNVYALYNADGTVPPRYKSNTFDGTHTHYLVSGGATLDSGDLDTMINDLKSHGYSKANGMTIVMLMNTREVDVARTFRVADRDVELFGGQPANTYRGLNVVGSYGDALLIEEDTIPPAYVATIATGGEANLNNPVGFRQHTNASLQGLRLVKGPNPDYPLIDSFYNRGFGTGIRQRGGAIIMQIKASGSYARPTQFVA
jgi:hypothetical protein